MDLETTRKIMELEQRLDTIPTPEVLGGNNILVGPYLIVPDDWWVGIGPALERIVIDAAGAISVMGADFGVGTLVPTTNVEVATAGTVGDGVYVTGGGHDIFLETEGVAVGANIKGYTDPAGDSTHAANSALRILLGSGAGVAGRIATSPITAIGVARVWTDIVTFLDTGNVGVMTGTPIGRFTVLGPDGDLQVLVDHDGTGTTHFPAGDPVGVAVTNNMTGAQAANAFFRAFEASSHDAVITALRIHHPGVVEYNIGINGTTLYIGDSTPALPGGRIFVLTAAGNVGAGVSDPDELMELYKVGTQLKLSGGAADYATFAVAADGELVITTVDVDAAAADIRFEPDGKVTVGDGKLFRVGTDVGAEPVVGVEDGCLVYMIDTDELRLRVDGAWVTVNTI